MPEILFSRLLKGIVTLKGAHDFVAWTPSTYCNLKCSLSCIYQSKGNIYLSIFYTTLEISPTCFLSSPLPTTNRFHVISLNSLLCFQIHKKELQNFHSWEHFLNLLRSYFQARPLFGSDKLFHQFGHSHNITLFRSKIYFSLKYLHTQKRQNK